ncbi:MAG: tRNA glutamyl-Q(34) synthetase GluQRS [Eggerthellaceae bacterium]|nr:tRNA glutamyl-Q(34) synthetase GluQRS [Eggerthellaceae bacterium]
MGNSGYIDTEKKEGQGVVGRFAPSPTGRMHAGNIFAYLCAWLVAKLQAGRIVLRIEDLDRERSKKDYSDQVLYDLEALGLYWDAGPFYQQDRDEAYEQALYVLEKRGLIYPCFCTRADLHAASAPHAGEHYVYAQTCKHLNAEEIKAKALLRNPAYRLSVCRDTIAFDDLIQGQCLVDLAQECGDFIVRRFDGNFAYQLAVVVDDAAQGVNSVVRGVDLLSSSPQQIYLQSLLGYEQPQYAHIPLLVDETGRRLAKRNKDAALDQLLIRHGTPEGVIGHIAYTAGLIDHDEPTSPQQLLDQLDIAAFENWKGSKKAILFQ